LTNTKPAARSAWCVRETELTKTNTNTKKFDKTNTKEAERSAGCVLRKAEFSNTNANELTNANMNKLIDTKAEISARLWTRGSAELPHKQRRRGSSFAHKNHKVDKAKHKTQSKTKKTVQSKTQKSEIW